MPDKKLTDNEIVKALVDAVICVGRAPFVEKQRKGEELKQNILDLINRQKAEIENLQKNFEEASNDRFIYKIRWAKAEARVDKAKAEAYKECIEKVKEEIYSQPHSRSLEASVERARIIKIFDNLLKELVGE